MPEDAFAVLAGGQWVCEQGGRVFCELGDLLCAGCGAWLGGVGVGVAWYVSCCKYLASTRALAGLDLACSLGPAMLSLPTFLSAVFDRGAVERRDVL
jgi:hypothetical protein